MFSEGIVEARVDQEVAEAGMVYPVNQHSEIARRMIAVSLLRACGVEVQTSVHVHNAGPKGSYGYVTRMRQHVVPTGEGGGRKRVRLDLESAKSSAKQVDSQGDKGQHQNGRREQEFLEHRQHLT
jgi:hypothetical protein